LSPTPWPLSPFSPYARFSRFAVIAAATRYAADAALIHVIMLLSPPITPIFIDAR